MRTHSAAARKKNTNHLLIHLGVIFTVIAWGGSFVMSKVLLDAGLGTAEIYAYRIAMAYLLMALISHNRLWARSLKDECMFLVIGMCAGSIYYIAENAALEYTLVSNVSLITTTSPLLTVLLLGIIYKNERPRAGTIVGSVVAIIGVGLVIFNSSLELKMNPLGDFLALMAAVSWAIYSILVRTLNATYDVMFITRKMFFYGLITTLPFMLLRGDAFNVEQLSQPVVWGNLLALGIVCSVMGFLIFNDATKRIGAVTANNYLYFQPVVTLILSAIILGEAITIVGCTGCFMILLGVFLSDYLARPRRK